MAKIGLTSIQSRRYRTFEEARKYVHTLGLKSQKEWKGYCKTHTFSDIPNRPDAVYQKDWRGWGDWLGTNRIAAQNKVFRDFEKAREFVQGLGLKSQKEWRMYTKSGKKPNDIPANPDSIYKEDWISWGDWFGTNRIADQNKVFRDFEKAREFVHGLRLRSSGEWIVYRKSGNKPDDIPANPNITYQKKWKGWGDWLGTITSREIDYMPFRKSREFVHRLRLKNRKQWEQYRQSGNKPTTLPSEPRRVYRDEWISWGDWLGTGMIATFNRQFTHTFMKFSNYLSFLESLRYVGRYDGDS